MPFMTTFKLMIPPYISLSLSPPSPNWLSRYLCWWPHRFGSLILVLIVNFGVVGLPPSTDIVHVESIQVIHLSYLCHSCVPPLFVHKFWPVSPSIPQLWLVDCGANTIFHLLITNGWEKWKWKMLVMWAIFHGNKNQIPKEGFASKLFLKLFFY